MGSDFVITVIKREEGSLVYNLVMKSDIFLQSNIMYPFQLNLLFLVLGSLYVYTVFTQTLSHIWSDLSSQIEDDIVEILVDCDFVLTM